MIRKTAATFTAIASIMLFSVMALSAKPMGPRHDDRDHHKGPGHHMDMDDDGPRGMCFGDPVFMKERLKLTEKQIEEIGEINKNYEKEYLKYRELNAPKKIKLKRLLLEDNVDLKEVKNTLKAISDNNVEIRLLRIRQRLDIEKKLTPEQRNRLRMEKKGHHRGMGPR